MVKKRKFEEAYSIFRKKNILLDEIVALFKENEVEYNANYKGKLLCPECRKAYLSFKPQAQPPHFFTPSKMNVTENQHNEFCSKVVELGTKGQVIKYVEDTKNKKQIERKLNSLLDTLLSHSSLFSPSCSLEDKKEAREKGPTFEVNKDKCVERKAFSTKRIDSIIKKVIPDDNYVMYYGTVIVEFEDIQIVDSTRTPFRNIFFRHIDPSYRKPLCRLTIWSEWRLKKVAPLLDSITNGQTYRVAFLGKITKYNQFNNCKIDQPEFLVIR